MIAAYALGGGLGHLTRVRAAVHSLGGDPDDLVVITSSPFATDRRVVGGSRIVTVPAALAADRQGLGAFIHDTLNAAAPTEIILDVFPAGILGELTAEVLDPSVPVRHLARSLRWNRYAPTLPADPPALATTYVLEPVGEEHQRYLIDHSATIAPLLLTDPEPHPARDGDDIVDPGQRALLDGTHQAVWLIVHSGPDHEILELVAYARDHAAATAGSSHEGGAGDHGGREPRFVLIAPSRPATLASDVAHLDVYPAWPLFAAADRVVTAGGFNAMRHASRCAERHLVLPFERRFDNQFARVQRMKRAVANNSSRPRSTAVSPEGTMNQATPRRAPVLGSTDTSWIDAAGAIHPPGTRPVPELDEGTDLIPEIDHIVVLVMENHSFDNYFGMLGRGDGFTLDADGRPTNINSDASGAEVRAYHLPHTTQPVTEPCPDWNNTHIQWNDGANDGFVRSESGRVAMGYWTDADIPFYWGLARTFPLCDRYFASTLSQTFPNRRFLQAGTARGEVKTDLPDLHEVAPNGTIFDRLNDFGISWKNYFGDLPEPALFPPVWFANQDKGATYDDFVKDAANGSLPAFALVTPRTDLSEENPQDIQEGEAFAASIINAVLESPCWPRTLMIWTYDEHGGYYDHVSPPEAVKPDEVEPKLESWHLPGSYDRLGFRVPCVVLSPYARPDHVSHVIHDHTSVLRTIETKWNLGAFTWRDANASNLLDCLDFDAPPAFLDPPSLPRPGIESHPDHHHDPTLSSVDKAHTVDVISHQGVTGEDH